MATSSLKDKIIGFLEKEQKSEPPKLSFHAGMTACLQGQHMVTQRYIKISPIPTD